jgi:hypothetical protein
MRGDGIIFGTTTTGTGTLTLAATPVQPGGIDIDAYVRATGIGFGNSAVFLVKYTIIEFTDSPTSSTFSNKAKQTETSIGTVTLGSSAGIANCTLARTILQTSATSLNSQPATQNFNPGAGISIGVAANTLIFIGPSASDLLAIDPFVDTTGANIGVFLCLAWWSRYAVFDACRHRLCYGCTCLERLCTHLRADNHREAG